MDLALLLKIISVSASGALAPGPLTASATALGARNGWKAGLRIAVGHTFVEFPLVLLIAYGLGSFFQVPAVRTLLGLIGGGFLLFFGWLTVKDALFVKNLSFENKHPKWKSAFAVGFFLTLFNPYFLAWWVGIGSSLLMEALTTISVVAIILFYFAHVWMDYMWLAFIAAAGSFSKLNVKVYKLILLLLSIMIFYFGIEMFYTTIINL